jgi:hypothetical protein
MPSEQLAPLAPLGRRHQRIELEHGRLRQIVRRRACLQLDKGAPLELLHRFAIGGDLLAPLGRCPETRRVRAREVFGEPVGRMATGVPRVVPGAIGVIYARAFVYDLRRDRRLYRELVGYFKRCQTLRRSLRRSSTRTSKSFGQIATERRVQTLLDGAIQRANGGASRSYQGFDLAKHCRGSGLALAETREIMLDFHAAVGGHRRGGREPYRLAEVGRTVEQVYREPICSCRSCQAVAA